MRVFIDTNIFLDILCRRERFVDDALGIFDMAVDDRIDLLISDLSIANIKYITRKELSLDKFYELIQAFHLYYSFSSNKSVSSSQALMREPATVSFTSYHFPVSTLPGRVTNRFLLSPIVCSIACCVLPSQPKFSQQ